MKSKLIYTCIALWISISSLQASYPQEIRYLSGSDQITLQIKISAQIKLFEDYCNKIADKSNPESLKEEYIKAAVNLFDPGEKLIEVSSTYKETEQRDIQTYLFLLKDLPYTQVKINYGTIRLNQPFYYSQEKSAETGQIWYENTVDIIQRFEARIADSLVYRDIVVRQIKLFGEMVGDTWTPHLGNIKVRQLDMASSIREGKACYDTGVKHMEVYKKQKELQLVGLEADEDQMYHSLLEAFLYFRNAYLLNTKYLQPIRKEVAYNPDDYMLAGIYYYNKSNYLGAYEGFNQYIEIATLPVFAGSKLSIDDENFVNAQYYAAIVATKVEAPEITIRLLERIKDSEYMNSEVYQDLALGYEKTGDTDNMERIFREGVKKYPEAPYLLLSLVDLYHRTGRNEEVIQDLQLAIKENPTNHLPYFAMGWFYEYVLNDLDNAESFFLQAFHLNPDYKDTISGLGRVYYNQAVAMLTEANMLFDPIAYTQEVEKAKEVMRKSLPYFEEIHSKDPQDREALMALRSIYYNLNMPYEFDEIDKKYELLE